MNIMHISTRLILGGSQENTVLSCMGQADDGHHVDLVYGPIHGPEGTLLPDVEAHGGINTIETPNLVREISPQRDLACYQELIECIRERKPDVVHTHSSKAGILGRSAAWKAGVPAVIHTIHGLPFHPYQSRLKNLVYILAEKHAAKRCHRIVTVADAMRDQARAKRIGRLEQYVTVRSGMRVEPFLDDRESKEETRARLGLPSNVCLIGTIARLAELKGHDDLLDALAEPMHKDPNLHLLWVGDGYWADRLLGRVREMGLEGQVHAVGLVEPETIPDWVRAMDILVHPSYREGLPRAVVQGMLGARPVVSYNLDGAPEVCIPGETGFLVEPGNLEELRSAIIALREDPEHARTLGEAGRARCREDFDWRVMVRRLQLVYEETLDAHDA
jgi:glycosyltransferase involved in cell wall biosynthesis